MQRMFHVKQIPFAKAGNPMKQVFDIVIVGGGAAGLVAGIEAKNQNPNLQVALLEHLRGRISLIRVRSNTSRQMRVWISAER